MRDILSYKRGCLVRGSSFDCGDGWRFGVSAFPCFPSAFSRNVFYIFRKIVYNNKMTGKLRGQKENQWGKNMKRTYLIDSENINDIWVEILHCMEDKDEILVFYTDKSAHMGYDRIIRLMEHKRGIVRWIRCFEGQNALDFQLVTELGSRIGQEPKREYIIVSNDTGYDAVVRYWQQREYRVRRMKSVECENLPDVTEELKTAERSADETKADEIKTAETNAAETKAAEAVAETETVVCENQKRERTDEKASRKKTDRLDERKKGRKKLSELRAERMRRQAEEEARAAADSETIPESETTPESEATPEAAGAGTGAEAEMQPVLNGTLEHRIPEQEPLKAENPASGTVSFTTAESWHEELETIFRESGSQDAGGDMKHLTELCKTVKLSDMSMVHNVLEYHFGQERGNAVYRFIKENPGCRGELSAGYSNNKKQREKQYLNLILKRNHIIAEDGELDAILKILGGIPRKNLNAIHIALVKRFGQEHGGTCYAVLRNHVKIIRSL